MLSAPDNRGTLFIVAFGENSNKNLDTELFVTTSRTTTVNVHVTAPLYTAQSINEQFTVTSGIVKQLALDNDLRMFGTTKSFKGILTSIVFSVIPTCTCRRWIIVSSIISNKLLIKIIIITMEWKIIMIDPYHFHYQKTLFL